MPRSTSLLTSLALLILLVPACDRPPIAAPTTSAAAAPAELRIYDVPVAFQGELQGVVGRLLYGGKEQPPAGTVALGPGGRLLVTATPKFHAGVEELVARITKEAPTAPPTMRIEYDIVLGLASETPTDEANFPAGIRHVVKALQEKHGPMDMRLADRVQILSLSGEGAGAEGAVVEIRQEASVRGDVILADLSLQPGGGQNMRTRLQLPIDEVVVLGYAGIAGGAVTRTFPELKGTGRPPTAFYLVRASVVGPKG